MSATAVQPPTWGTIDLSSTPRVPFSRLVRVELRKTYDTRAGLWLLIAMGIVTALVMVVQLWVVAAQDLTVSYSGFMTSTSFSIAVFLPILGILLLTSEWSQRTAMVTFALEPHRMRVVLAKLTVGLALAVGSVVVALALGAVCNLLYGALTGNPVEWNMGPLAIGGFFLLQLIGILIGFGFAAVLLSSPAAIVAYMVFSFILPGIFAFASLVSWLDKVVTWIDLNTAQTPLADASMTGKDWAHLATSLVVWLAVPMVLGLRRVMRAEVK